MLVKSLIIIFLQFSLALITSYGGCSNQAIVKVKPQPTVQTCEPCCTKDAPLFSSPLMFPLSNI